MAFSILAVFIFVLTWNCTSSKVSWLFLSNIQPDTLSGVWIPNFLISRNCSLSSEQHEKSVWSPSWWVDKRTSPSPLAFGHGPSTACSIAGGTIEARHLHPDLQRLGMGTAHHALQAQADFAGQRACWLTSLNGVAWKFNTWTKCLLRWMHRSNTTVGPPLERARSTPR